MDRSERELTAILREIAITLEHILDIDKELVKQVGKLTKATYTIEPVDNKNG